jgi:hypothetical protein
MFNTLEWRAFFIALGYETPHRKTLARSILDACYKDIKAQVTTVINSSANLGIVADESTNISGTRIKNVSVIYKGASYFWSNQSLKDKNTTAANGIKSVKDKALEITNGNLKRLSALSTNTCPTQQAVWNLLLKDQELAHVFRIGCDSHGQQLVIKDIIDPGKEDGTKIPSKIYDFWLEFQSIITYFGHKATLQLGILRQKQIDSINKTIALIAAGNTR